MFLLEAKLKFDSEEEAEKIVSAVFPELNSSHAQRSKTILVNKKNEIDLKIESKDAIALRASFNSVFKGIMLSKKLLNDF